MIPRLILIGAVGMQTVAAPAGGRIVQRQAQIVAPEEPLEGASGFFAPAGVVCAAVGFEAGGDRGLRFNRLLIEAGAFAAALIKAVGADRDKMPFIRVRVLQISQPGEGFQSDVGMALFGIHWPHKSMACGSTALQ